VREPHLEGSGTPFAPISVRLSGVPIRDGVCLMLFARNLLPFAVIAIGLLLAATWTAFIGLQLLKVIEILL